jgi:hypothetical protein
MSRNNRHKDIEVLAYHKWEEAGCPEGMQESFWLSAEQDYDSTHLVLNLEEEIHLEEAQSCCSGGGCKSKQVGV